MLVGSHEKTSATDNLPAQTIVVFTGLRIISKSDAVQLLHKMESDLTPKPPPPRPYYQPLSNNAALALLDELEQLPDLFARFDFLPNRFDCLASVQFRSVK